VHSHEVGAERYDVFVQVVLCFMIMSAQDALGGDDAAGNREYV